MPMVHKTQIIGVVMANLLKAVGKFLTSGKKLLKVGKTRRHGMTSCVYDRGVGQNGLDQSNVYPVIRQFIDKIGLVRPVSRRSI